MVQAGPRAPDLDAPSVEALARNADDRKIIELVVSGTRLGRPMATTPGVPDDRVAALRAAYRATMADPEFRAEAAKLNFEVAPVYGEDMQRIVERHRRHAQGAGRPRQASDGVAPAAAASQFGPSS